MPLYNYKCLDCRQEDQRLGGLDDASAVCIECGGLMLRLDDPWGDLILWDEPPKVEVSRGL